MGSDGGTGGVAMGKMSGWLLSNASGLSWNFDGYQ